MTMDQLGETVHECTHDVVEKSVFFRSGTNCYFSFLLLPRLPTYQFHYHLTLARFQLLTVRQKERFSSRFCDENWTVRFSG